VVKTKFDAIVKLKKMKLDEVNNEVSQLNSKIEMATQQLTKLQKEISDFEYPTSGNFSLITQFRTILDAKLVEINQKRLEIDYLNNQKNILAERLKEVNLEFEKIKYKGIWPERQVLKPRYFSAAICSFLPLLSKP
jgi:chromosome segregation ATPase